MTTDCRRLVTEKSLEFFILHLHKNLGALVTDFLIKRAIAWSSIKKLDELMALTELRLSLKYRLFDSLILPNFLTGLKLGDQRNDEKIRWIGASCWVSREQTKSEMRKFSPI